ncbi:MAG: DUF4249 family protein [Ignavibacteria bacterium]|nr:DUF4249 family protein [Ignavibacteria bacterium]
MQILINMNFLKRFYLFLFLPLLFVLFSCGETVVEIGQNTYNPKIVIEGYLLPGNKVSNIRISRNIPLNTYIDPKDVILSDANVKIIDLQNNKEYSLKYNPAKFSFEYVGNDLKIDHNNSYKLIVSAVIDSKQLTASSITKVPAKGFKLLTGDSILDSLKYREMNSQGDMKNFNFSFAPSPGTSFYGFSFIALDADTSSFIFNNAYVNVTMKDLRERFDNFKFRARWLQNVNSYSDKISLKLEWLEIWFYSRYRAIIYAGDENFRLFFLTFKTVQEFDGNFHEPRINIQGDGIGIFGSAIADTVYFKVLK